MRSRCIWNYLPRVYLDTSFLQCIINIQGKQKRIIFRCPIHISQKVRFRWAHHLSSSEALSAGITWADIRVNVNYCQGRIRGCVIGVRWTPLLDEYYISKHCWHLNIWLGILPASIIKMLMESLVMSNLNYALSV